MKWAPYTYNEVEYDFKHLEPCTLRFARPAENGCSAESYTVNIRFTIHCFTRDPIAGDEPRFPDDYEERVFDVRRYEMSKLLPELIANLPNSKVKISGPTKYFTIQALTLDGCRVEYDVFFKLRKVSKGQPLEMIVESAFVRDPEYGSTRPKGKPVGFWVVLHNTLNNKPIRH